MAIRNVGDTFYGNQRHDKQVFMVTRDMGSGICQLEVRWIRLGAWEIYGKQKYEEQVYGKWEHGGRIFMGSRNMGSKFYGKWDCEENFSSNSKYGKKKKL